MVKVILAIWNYVRNSWEGEDKLFSYKRASQFVFVWLIVFMVLQNRTDSRWNFYTFLTLAILFSVTAAIITVPQLIKLIKYYCRSKKNREDDEDNNDLGGGIPPGQLPT